MNGLAKTCSEPAMLKGVSGREEVHRESLLSRYGEGIAAAACGLFTLIAWLSESALGWGSTLLYVLAYGIGGFAKGREGILTLTQERKLDVNLLMIIAAIGAAAIGYWLEGAVLIFIFALSGAMERVAEARSKRDLSSLMEMKPEMALRVDGQGGQRVVPIEELRIGDSVLIRPGSRIPVDGRVVEGRSAVNQASITGESLPVDKGEGDEVYAGTMNGRGSLLVEVTRLADESLFSKIIRLVEKAQKEVPQSQRVIERLEKWYVSAVLLATGLLMTVPPLLFSWSWSGSFYRAMVFLVVASPCAVMASIMPTVLSAMSNGARKGVLFKGSMVLEGLAGVKVVAFDKTGTLTEGRLQVTDVIPVDQYGEEELLRIAASIESVSEHPIAQAIVAEARRRGMDLQRPALFESMTGRGVVADWAGERWKVGKPSFVSEGELDEENARMIDRLEGDGKTVIGIASGGGVVGWIALQDRVRPEAKAAVSRLKRMGIRVVMLTGDRRSTGEAIGAQVGVDEVHAELLPEDKVRLIQELEKKYGRVAMAGDGVNDAPALATASVGIAMGRAGTDVALDVADVVLMNDDLDRVATALSLGRRARTVIVQNLAFASLVILSLILANFGGHITLPFGVVGHEGSTILVILNGLRLLR